MLSDNDVEADDDNEYCCYYYYCCEMLLIIDPSGCLSWIVE